MLSNTCKYAIRAVTYIAINDDGRNKIGLKQISEDLKIPTPFLGKILQLLAKNKVLLSTKGPHGGFSLGKNANNISLYEIVKIIDGLEFFTECIFGYKVCNNTPTLKNDCPVHPKSGPIRDELLQLFKKQTVGEIAESFKNTDQQLEF